MGNAKESTNEFWHPSGPAFVWKPNGVEVARISPSGLSLTAPLASPRINGIQGLKSFGQLGASAATGIIPIDAASGTVFNIPATSTVANMFALQPGAAHADMLLIQNGSVATQAIYNLGVGGSGAGSGLLFQLNPSGAA